MAESVLGRPGRFGLERCVQRRRSHWRCHRSTVSGCTTIKAVRHSRHPLARRIQKSRSLRRSCGRFTVRVNAASCCRSARFSSATARCPRQSSPTNRKSATSAVRVRDLVVHSTTESSGRTGGHVMANHSHRNSGSGIQELLTRARGSVGSDVLYDAFVHALEVHAPRFTAPSLGDRVARLAQAVGEHRWKLSRLNYGGS